MRVTPAGADSRPLEAKRGIDNFLTENTIAYPGRKGEENLIHFGRFGNFDWYFPCEFESGEWTIHIVDVSGRYKERTGGGPFAGGKVVERTGYAMTGAILVHDVGRKYFVKMIGPQQVVNANRKAFVEMIKGIEEI